jgi:hypothetical protein
MSFWVIVSWVCVLILTGINVFIFLKLKQASEQMLKQMFPNAKNMNEALAGMQGMMSGMQGMMGGAKGGMPGMGAGGGRPGGGIANSFGGKRGAQGGGKQNSDAQLKAAMEMLNKMQKR